MRLSHSLVMLSDVLKFNCESSLIVPHQHWIACLEFKNSRTPVQNFHLFQILHVIDANCKTRQVHLHKYGFMMIVRKDLKWQSVLFDSHRINKSSRWGHEQVYSVKEHLRSVETSAGPFTSITTTGYSGKKASMLNWELGIACVSKLNLNINVTRCIITIKVSNRCSR